MKNLPIVILFIFTSCAEMDIFARRSFADQMEKEDRPLFMAGEDFQVVPGDTGKQFRTKKEIQERTPPTKHEQKMARYDESLNKELLGYEAKLDEGEIESYQKEEKNLESLSERIYYLRLPARQRASYMQLKRGPASTDPGRPLSLGMSKNNVRLKWGPPIKVEIAGNPSAQNERWTYYRGGRLQKIYFEEGSLRGWDL